MSRSKFWKSTAIFVLEDDAQNGPDHIDSHRSAAFIISPYTHTGTIDSSMYNTTSMLRTMELILHLRPMTHFDAGARPMLGAFAKEGVFTPYQAEKPRISLEERNPAEFADRRPIRAARFQRGRSERRRRTERHPVARA